MKSLSNAMGKDEGTRTYPCKGCRTMVEVSFGRPDAVAALCDACYAKHAAQLQSRMMAESEADVQTWMAFRKQWLVSGEQRRAELERDIMRQFHDKGTYGDLVRKWVSQQVERETKSGARRARATGAGAGF